MADNLPMHLSFDQVQALKARILAIPEAFAKEHGLDHGRVLLELGFICAHLAAKAGVLPSTYLEWMNASRPVSNGIGLASPRDDGEDDGG